MTTDEIPELYAWVKELGGYFKRFNGEQLRPWINPEVSQERMALHARALATFFQVDRNLSSEPAAKTSGSTASVAIIHTLDAPFRPFFSAEKVALTVAHVGSVTLSHHHHMLKLAPVILGCCYAPSRKAEFSL